MVLKKIIKTKVKKTITLASFCSLFTGCATMIGGSKDKIELTSYPLDAQVYLGDTYIGQTPLQYNFERNSNESVTVKKEGYKPVDFKLEKEFNTLATLNLINVFFWSADAMMGNLRKYSQEKIHVTLTKIKQNIPLLGHQTLKDSTKLNKRRLASKNESL
ncbi:PEGA domain-containing protein [Bacteriovorax sp. BSW11_IV]|uniref:PEGA domain-containing protein n=1 Tax=Bacteriovorax sp. BSW11_IV TaxID=1353529 RepID=UPI0009DC3CC9|nr:PEGA domain-containing protein [Bacteriovorax sp. BSW11_IV]